MATYPWHRWCDGEEYTVHQNVDFWCTVQSFRQMLYQRARKRAMHVEVHIEGDVEVMRSMFVTAVTFRFVKEFQDG